MQNKLYYLILLENKEYGSKWQNLKYFNKLCTADEYPPCILVVYLLNPNRDKWLLHNSKCLKTSRTAYWYTLRGCKEITNKLPESSEYINIPLKNIFSPDTLESMMIIAKGEKLVNGSI